MEPKELGRRITAAMKVAGLTQETLGDLFAEDDLGKEDPGRIIRGKRVAGPARLDALVKHTGFPRAWFTEPDLEKVFAPTAPSGEAEWSATVLDDAALAEALAELAEAQQQLQRAQELLRRALPPGG